MVLSPICFRWRRGQPGTIGAEIEDTSELMAVVPLSVNAISVAGAMLVVVAKVSE